ncbi:hypothetical protein JHK85_053961 [Glycine max]|nr:hypothetical protein JHK85_053961 [Glycine max]
MIGEDHKANDSDPTHPTVWKCPGVSIIKINFDDSVMSQNNIGMDMVARDHNDLMLAAMALSFAASTPLALEEEPLPHTDDDCDVNNDDDAFFGIVSLDDKGFP